MTGSNNYDCMLHLVGEQALPIHIAICQFDCPCHVLAVTDKTRDVGAIVRQEAPPELQVELLVVPAYDLKEVVRILRDRVSKTQGARWCFNLTGGTKPMFAGGMIVAQGLSACYVETTNKTLDWLTEGVGVGKETLKPVMGDVETFVRLAGYAVTKDSTVLCEKTANERIAVSEHCWRERRLLATTYRRMAEHNKHPGCPFKEGDITGKTGLAAELKGPVEQYQGTLRINDRSYRQNLWQDLAGYIAGGWFEEFVWTKMQTLFTQGDVKDVRLRLSPVGGVGERANPVQEFDLSFTDGFYLSIVECKAGEIKQDHIQKLENLALRFGGHFGRGILLFADPAKLDVSTRKRIADSNMIAGVSGEVLVNDPKAILRVKPGEVLETNYSGKRK